MPTVNESFGLEQTMGFIGKVILITGGGSGIGAAAALYLAKLGAKVAIDDINGNGLFAIAEHIKQSGAPTPLPIIADVTKDAERIVDETIKHFGQLDCLVNSAGLGVLDNVFNAKASDFDRIFDLNVKSVIKLTQLCIPHLEKTKGNIINVSSVAGLQPVPVYMSYCLSKAALDQFTKCAALDLATKGIRVNSINPAKIWTQIFERAGMSPEEIKNLFAETKMKYPLGRIGEVWIQLQSYLEKLLKITITVQGIGYERSYCLFSR